MDDDLYVGHHFERQRTRWKSATTVVVVVFTLTRIIKSVAGQAPVTLELRNTRGKNTHNPRWYTNISQLTQFVPPPETYKSEIGSQSTMCQVHRAGAFVSLLTPGETNYSDCHPRKTTTYILYVVSITTHTHDRSKSIREKETKKRKEKIKERKEKRRKTKQNVFLCSTYGVPLEISASPSLPLRASCITFRRTPVVCLAFCFHVISFVFAPLCTRYCFSFFLHIYLVWLILLSSCTWCVNPLLR